MAYDVLSLISIYCRFIFIVVILLVSIKQKHVIFVFYQLLFSWMDRNSISMHPHIDLHKSDVDFKQICLVSLVNTFLVRVISA